MIVKIITLVLVLWISLGVIAYIQAARRGGKRGHPRPFFLRDGFFYDSILHGAIAFYLEFFV